MSTEHTPGPWRTHRPHHGTIYIDAPIGNGMLQEVAAIGPTEGAGQQEANARLIVAAPELLEALKTARAYGSDSWSEWITEKVDAALVKAEKP